MVKLYVPLQMFLTFVLGAPKINSVSEALTVNIKTTVKIYCNVTGSPKPQVTWFKKHSNQMPGYFYIKDGYLMIPIVESGDGGIYICHAENTEGIAEAQIELKVNGKIIKINKIFSYSVLYFKLGSHWVLNKRLIYILIFSSARYMKRYSPNELLRIIIARDQGTMKLYLILFVYAFFIRMSKFQLRIDVLIVLLIFSLIPFFGVPIKNLFSILEFY